LGNLQMVLISLAGGWNQFPEGSKDEEQAQAKGG
jgi:hypothetical protein